MRFGAGGVRVRSGSNKDKDELISDAGVIISGSLLAHLTDSCSFPGNDLDGGIIFARKGDWILSNNSFEESDSGSCSINWEITKHAAWMYLCGKINPVVCFSFPFPFKSSDTGKDSEADPVMIPID